MSKMRASLLWVTGAMALLSTHSQAAPNVNCPSPDLPREALRYELSGATTLRYAVGKNGRAMSVSIQESSGWKLLDNAALTSLSRCVRLEPTPEGVTIPAQYAWRLDGEETLRPLLVPGSCKASERFDVFKNLDKSPSNADGVVLRMLIKSDGVPLNVVAEESDLSPELVDEAIAYIQGCRFAIAPDVRGKPMGATYGKLLRKGK